ncbi:MAG: hypothetical protein NZT92_02675 [Abditibacteriales bacterium]|nr:hypothetical protein [Abditibacteriales bacterium]MDW8364750.1 hypothetical protein [Abditibacteriales bacterium]
MNKQLALVAAIVVLIAAVLALTLRGCGRTSDGLSPQQVQAGNRLQEIAARTGGDWNKLSPEERAFLMQLSHNNERSARMLLLNAARTGPPSPTPGGPPRRTGGGSGR